VGGNRVAVGGTAVGGIRVQVGCAGVAVCGIVVRCCVGAKVTVRCWASVALPNGTVGVADADTLVLIGSSLTHSRFGSFGQGCTYAVDFASAVPPTGCWSSAIPAHPANAMTIATDGPTVTRITGRQSGAWRRPSARIRGVAPLGTVRRRRYRRHRPKVGRGATPRDRSKSQLRCRIRTGPWP
jgi:hypothetical protein